MKRLSSRRPWRLWLGGWSPSLGRRRSGAQLLSCSTGNCRVGGRCEETKQKGTGWRSISSPLTCLRAPHPHPHPHATATAMTLHHVPTLACIHQPPNPIADSVAYPMGDRTHLPGCSAKLGLCWGSQRPSCGPGPFMASTAINVGKPQAPEAAWEWHPATRSALMEQGLGVTETGDRDQRAGLWWPPGQKGEQSIHNIG
jgi:hypothetical protein